MRHYAVLAVALTSLSTASAQTADVWKRVLPTPTTCFADQDYQTKLNAAIQQTLADENKQNELNAKITEQFGKIDPMQRMQRMQAWMMKNPTEATRMLETASGSGQAAATTSVEADAAVTRIEKELGDNKKAYDATIDEALKPIRAREQALVKAKAPPFGEAREPAFVNAADYAQYVAILAEENAAIEKVCAPFFGPKGAFNALMDRYRTEVSEKMIAFGETTDAAMRQQMAIMDSPTGGYRSTAALNNVRAYMDKLYKVSDYRRAKLTPTIPLEKK